MKKLIFGFTLASQFFASAVFPLAGSAWAHSPTYGYEGLFAGSMVCENGEIGVLFHIEENGPITRGEFDRINDTCRSGSGFCNVSRNLKYVGTRKVKGTLDFFPTASNPKLTKTRFEITGTGTRQETEAQSKMAVMRPEFTDKYLEISSALTPNFPTDLSGLEFRITIDNPRATPPYDKMFARVDGHQCHNLTLTKVKETKP